MTDVQIKRNDHRPGVTITCLDGEQPAPLDEATQLRLLGSIDGTLKVDRLVTGDAQGEVVVDKWLTGETDLAGLMLIEVEATWADGSVQTFPSNGYLQVDVLPDLG